MTKREMTIDDFDEANFVKEKINDLRKRRHAWNLGVKQANREFEREESEIYAMCKHWFSKYHPDPSGNNDSHEECLICGKVAKRLGE